MATTNQEMSLISMNPFAQQGHWFRGNIHSHSLNSDGWISPETLVKSYAALGYHFLSITDHWKLTTVNYKPSDDFLLIPGIELDGGKTEVGNFHFVGLGIQQPIVKTRESNEQYTAQELVDLILAAGGLPILAHPSWNGVIISDIISLEGLLGLEVYNTGCDVEINRGYAEVQWNDLLSRGKKLYGFAVDDCHRIYYDTFQGWLWVKAAELTQSAILEAIKLGRFYSTMGPVIHHLELQNNYVRVHCSPARRINLVANPTRGHCFIAREGELITDIKLPIPANITFFRLEVVDSLGRKAWTNPFSLSPT